MKGFDEELNLLLVRITTIAAIDYYSRANSSIPIGLGQRNPAHKIETKTARTRL